MAPPPVNGNSSSPEADDDAVVAASPPPPPARSEEGVIHYVVRHPWKWVMRKLQESERMTEADTPSDLPSAKLAAAAAAGDNTVPLNGGTESVTANTPTTPASRRRRQKIRDKLNVPATLRIEVVNPKTGALELAIHGTSSAFDGLEDKDELLRTIQRCRVEELGLSPPSILINWDVTREECLNVIGKGLPKLKTNQNDEIIAVLKEPMGSQGRGIFFVKDAEEIHKIISEHRQRALDEPHFLDNLIERKGRIPSWGKYSSRFSLRSKCNMFSVNKFLTHTATSTLGAFSVLQAEVIPALLIENRKFHIRSYLLVTEQPNLEGWLEMFIYNRHEVRIAGVPVKENDSERDPLAHITNGALSNTTERRLIEQVPQLKDSGFQDKLETFIAETFGKHLLPDISRRVGYSLNQNSDSKIKQFAIAGLDLMVTAEGRIFLLEANVNPAAPPASMVNDDFLGHLTGFMQDLLNLVMGKPAPNFLSVEDILTQKGLLS